MIRKYAEYDEELVSAFESNLDDKESEDDAGKTPLEYKDKLAKALNFLNNAMSELEEVPDCDDCCDKIMDAINCLGDMGVKAKEITDSENVEDDVQEDIEDQMEE